MRLNGFPNSNCNKRTTTMAAKWGNISGHKIGNHHFVRNNCFTESTTKLTRLCKGNFIESITMLNVAALLVLQLMQCTQKADILGQTSPSWCNAVWYHWRELSQVSFLSRQNVCHDRGFVSTTMCLSRQNTSLFATKVCLSSKQKFCLDKHTFVGTKDVFCRDKNVFVATKVCLSRQNLCHDKRFVATKMIFVAAPANDSLDNATITVSGLHRPLLGQPTSANAIRRQHACSIAWAYAL